MDIKLNRHPHSSSQSKRPVLSQWPLDNPLAELSQRLFLWFCASSWLSSSSSSLLSSPFICKERKQLLYIILYVPFPKEFIFGHTHFTKHEFDDHAQDERRPEHVQQQQHHQHAVEEIISKEWLKLFQRINPRTVDQPATRPALTHSPPNTPLFRFIRSLFISSSHSYSSFLPEGEDDQPGDHEDHREEDEDGVTGTRPSGVIKHLPQLTERNTGIFINK